MINKEQVQKDTSTTQTHHVEVEQIGSESWNIIKNKGTKRRTEGNVNLKDSQLQNIKEAVLTTNRFTPLITTSNMTVNEEVKKSACKNIPRASSSGRKQEVKNPELASSTAVNLQERLNANTKKKHNLKTHSETLQHPCVTKEESCPIPTLINGQITNDDSSMKIKQLSSHHQKMKQKPAKTLVSSLCRRNKVLVIGDSHVRHLSEKIRNKLNFPCNVTGITKPRANAESITSPSHFAAENLTKNDLLIFYEGTRDISRNEANNGLKALEAFAHRTTNTNVILLETPHRYGLSPSSCVNTEVTRFNKRLHSLATTFNHVKVLSVPTERRFHTNHGLHLNQRGKDWIASNLVKEIRYLHLPGNTTPPIRLPWKDINEKACQLALGNQVSPVSSYDVQECPSPVSKNENSQTPGEGTESCNDEDLQEDETICRSNRVKKTPTNKYQDFLCQMKSIDQPV